MLDEIVESVVPGGALVAVGVAVGAAFGKQLRPFAKQAIKWGMAAAAEVQEVAAEAYEQGQDLVAEARHEYDEENQAKVRPLPVASRRRARPSVEA